MHIHSNDAYYSDTYLAQGRVGQRDYAKLVCRLDQTLCVIFIGVVSVFMRSIFVYYCDTYIPGTLRRGSAGCTAPV
jgi:hypothetical protein